MHVCVFFSLSLSFATPPPSPKHTRQPTLWPLPLSAGWLPRLQCRLSSSCCYETRTDRPELNDNVSVALARDPQQPIRDSLDKHFSIWGQGTSRVIVWFGRSLLSHMRSSFLISLNEKICTLLYAELIRVSSLKMFDKNVDPTHDDSCPARKNTK